MYAAKPQLSKLWLSEHLALDQTLNYPNVFAWSQLAPIIEVALYSYIVLPFLLSDMIVNMQNILICNSIEEALHNFSVLVLTPNTQLPIRVGGFSHWQDLSKDAKPFIPFYEQSKNNNVIDYRGYLSTRTTWFPKLGKNSDPAIDFTVHTNTLQDTKPLRCVLTHCIGCSLCHIQYTCMTQGATSTMVN